MAAVSLTVKQIMNLGLWDKVCEYKGWDTWILNEGRIDENEAVEFDDSFKKPEAVKTDIEKVKELYEEWSYMKSWNGHDGHDARLVCETIEKTLDALGIEIEGINNQ